MSNDPKSGSAGADLPSGRASGGVGEYVRRQASSPLRYVVEQLIFALAGWIPTVLGIAVRAVLYRLIMHMDGLAAIENGVRLRFADGIRLGRNVYRPDKDQGSMHAANTWIDAIYGAAEKGFRGAESDRMNRTDRRQNPAPR